MKESQIRKSKLIPSMWNVPEKFHKRLGQKAGRQRAMIHDGHALLILDDVPVPDKPQRTGVLFWRAPEGEWKTTDVGNGITAIDALVERYAKEVDALEEMLAKAVAARDFFEVLRGANPIRRAARSLKDALQCAREGLPDALEIITIRDRAQEVSLAADLLIEDGKNGLDFDLAETAERQARIGDGLNRASHRLNLIAALFLPMTALTSAFGMNLPSGLEGINSPVLFWITLVAGLVIGFVMKGKFEVVNER